MTLAPPVASSQSVTTAFQTATADHAGRGGAGHDHLPDVGTMAHGTMTGTAPKVTYTPTANYVGSDSFTFKVNNGAHSNMATVSIRCPRRRRLSRRIRRWGRATRLGSRLRFRRPGLGTITYAVATQPAHGTLSGTAPALTYTPNARATSGRTALPSQQPIPGGPATGTVSITDAPPPPVAQAGDGDCGVMRGGSDHPGGDGRGTITYSVVAGRRMER